MISPVSVNGHFHTPYSFSAFSAIEQVFEMASQEAVQVLGINDFYTTDGYGEFALLAEKYKIYPLFNIEFMALQKDLQADGVRVNDPNNPGRTYFSGKGLRYPLQFNAEMMDRLFKVQDESNRQTAQMVDKLNEFLQEIEAGFQFSFKQVKEKYAKNILRERHIAKALREKVVEVYPDVEKQKAFIQKLFSGKEVKSSMDDFAGLENEIRGNLLKSGGRAFVPEDDKAFLSLEQVIEFILHAGGIPCYPVLLDDVKGNFTDYEGDYQKLYESLVEKSVYSIELIPGRNKPAILEDFVRYFNEKGFVITFGTEHNTPKLDPITVFDGEGNELSEEMKQIAYEGACVIAAHQELVRKDEDGFLDASGKAKLSERELFIGMGDEIIKNFVRK